MRESNPFHGISRQAGQHNIITAINKKKKNGNVRAKNNNGITSALRLLTFSYSYFHLLAIKILLNV